MAKYLPSDDWMNTYGIAFPLYRLTGANVDYGKLLRLGIPGLRREVTERRERAAAEGSPVDLFDGMLIALDVLEDACRHYEAEALHEAEATSDPQRRSELEKLADTLANIRREPPQTFHEAIQLF